MLAISQRSKSIRNTRNGFQLMEHYLEKLYFAYRNKQIPFEGVLENLRKAVYNNKMPLHEAIDFIAAIIDEDGNPI